jgi:GH24 family phage-related lysozyme (muramidase)
MDDNMFFKGVLSDYQDDMPEAPVSPSQPSLSPAIPSQGVVEESPAERPTEVPAMDEGEEAQSFPLDMGGDIRSRPIPRNPTPVQATSRNEFGHKNESTEREVDDRDDVINLVLGELGQHEGEEGDTTGAAPTLGKGLTEKTYQLMKKRYGDNISEAEARKYYMNELYDAWEAKPGWESASPQLRAALLDSGYNLGTAPTRYKKLGKALEKVREGGSEADVMKELLDTATTGGMSMKGLAKRRAAMYNKVAEVPIAEIEQSDNGTIYYRDANGKVIKRFKPKKGRHPQSIPEVISV